MVRLPISCFYCILPELHLTGTIELDFIFRARPQATSKKLTEIIITTECGLEAKRN